MICLKAMRVTVFVVICSVSAISACKKKPEVQIMKKDYLHGMRIDEVLKDLGEPNKRYVFKMEECCDEFRGELLNTYPPNKSSNSEVVIKELWWKDGDYILTVWFHKVSDKWIVLDTCYRHKNIIF